MKKFFLFFFLAALLIAVNAPAGVITKPNTFTGTTSPQLPWLDADFDTIYSEFNGNIDDTNIKPGANIQQSKILNLTTDLTNRLPLSGGTLSGTLTLRSAGSGPAFIMKNVSGAYREWYFQLDSDNILRWLENTGTEASPSYVGRYVLSPGGTPTEAGALTTKNYVDTADALKVSKAGDTMTGDLLISKTLPRLSLHYPGIEKWSFETAVGALNIYTDPDVLRYTLRGTGTPSNSTDLTPKSYVDGYAVAKTGDTMTGNLSINNASPTIYLRNTNNGEGDFAIQPQQAANGSLVFYENTGTFAAPSYSAIASISYNGTPATSIDLTTKSYVDALTSSLPLGAITKIDGDYTIASVSMTDVTGLSTNFTTAARRVRVSFAGSILNSSGALRNYTISWGMDTITQYPAVVVSAADGQYANASFSVVSPVLTAASHTFTIQVATSSATGTQTLLANATNAAMFSVEELAY